MASHNVVKNDAIWSVLIHTCRGHVRVIVGKGHLLCLSAFSAPQCHVSAVPVYHSMKKRSVQRFVGVIVVAMGFDVLVYSLAGAFGLLSFGTGTCSDILKNYEPKDYYMVVSRLALAFNIVTSYPILHYCGRWVRGILKRNLLFGQRNDDGGRTEVLPCQHP